VNRGDSRQAVALRGEPDAAIAAAEYRGLLNGIDTPYDRARAQELRHNGVRAGQPYSYGFGFS
jgi:hypothetical protein